MATQEQNLIPVTIPCVLAKPRSQARLTCQGKSVFANPVRIGFFGGPNNEE